MERPYEAKLLCVPFKDGHSTEKIRRRILKRLKKVERKSCSSIFIKPLCQPLTADIHTVVSNSNYVAFLLKDGRVCRMKVSSLVGHTSHQLVQDGRRPDSQESSFQVLSDAEYARRLQAQFDQETDGRGGALERYRVMDGLGPAALSPYISLPQSWSPPSLGGTFTATLPPSSPPTQPAEYVAAHNAYLPTYSRLPPQVERQLSDMAGTADQSNDTIAMTDDNGRSTEANSVHVVKNFTVATPTSNGTPICTCGLGTNDDNRSRVLKRKENVWPEIGEIEWLITKQVLIIYIEFKFIIA